MKKEKIKIGKLTKGILILAQQLLAAVCIASIVMLGINASNPIALPFQLELESDDVNYMEYPQYSYDSRSMFLMSVFTPQAKNEDTTGFGALIAADAKRIVRYCVIREQFETDGQFDAKKKIDIEQYARHKEYVVQKEHTANTEDATLNLVTADMGVSYYLEDLISWSQYGLVVDYVEESEFNKLWSWTGEETASEKPKYEDVTEYNSEENIYTYENTDEGSSLYSVHVREDGKTYIPVPRERYKTADGKPLAAYVGNAEQYAQYISYLAETINMITVNYADYQAFEKYYDEQNLNLKYYVTLGEGTAQRVYTNLTAEKTAQSPADFSEFARYVYYEPTTSAYETNIPGMHVEYLRNTWQQYTYAFTEPCTIRIGVDTSYPYDDNYKVISEGYRAWAEENIEFAKTAVYAAAFALLLLFVLTFFAGRKKGTEGVALNAFDKLNTESAIILSGILLFLLTGLFGIMMSGMDNVSYQYDWTSGIAHRISLTDEMILLFGGIAGAWALVANSFFLFFYLSLVRRLKAHTFFANSLIMRLCRKIKRSVTLLWTNSSSAVRTVVPALIVGAVNIVLSVFATFCLDSWLWMLGIFIFMFIMAVDIVLGMLLFEEARKRQEIVDGIRKINDGHLSHQIETKGMHGENLELAGAVNSIGAGIQKAVEVSMKDERMKADLITNVSHDIKTPLTSIISYVDLLKRENIQNETAKGYIDVLDMKSQRLKQLTEDLVEASKISSGNITLDMKRLNLVELLQQTAGEFEEKFQAKGIQLMMTLPELPVMIEADSRRMWRIIENLYHNICKYALGGTRAYIDLSQEETKDAGRQAVLTIKNISAQPLNIAADELTERFIRGDISRSTEGSGLGLSIAKSLAEVQNGTFDIYLDGDLFKVTMRFPVVEEK